MIEVLFGESESASMRAAKSVVIAGRTDGPTSVWAIGKKKPPKRAFSGWVPGMADEVICLGFLLDIGDIREPLDGSYRRKLIYSLYEQQWGVAPDMKEGLWEIADCYVEELRRFQKYLEEGEAIRVWHSNAPYSKCGFYSLCGLLREHENDVSVVELPEQRVLAGEVVSYQSWGEVTAEEFAGFLPYEKKLSKEEVRAYAYLWDRLKEDNSPLRAVVSGRLIGVPENFYDFMIWEKLKNVPVMEGRLIGDILLQYPVGVSAGWYAKRMDAFIAQGKVRVTQDSENKYARTICRA